MCSSRDRGISTTSRTLFCNAATYRTMNLCLSGYSALLAQISNPSLSRSFSAATHEAKPMSPSSHFHDSPHLSKVLSAASTLTSLLTCPACNRPFHHARPWRSTRCDHSFCAACAAIARGNLDPNASETPIAATGVCPVPACKLPVRPSEIAEDVGLRPVLDAAAKLERWLHTCTPAEHSA